MFRDLLLLFFLQLPFSTSALFLITILSILFMDLSISDNQIGGPAVSSCGFLGVLILGLICPLKSFCDFESVDRQNVCGASAFFPLDHS
jgi:hypothetical protein